MAGISKLLAPLFAANFVRALSGIDYALAVQIVQGGAAVKVVLSVALVVSRRGNSRAGWVALLLCCVFLGFLLRAVITAPTGARCGCFGATPAPHHMVSVPAQVWLDAGLILLLLVHLLLPGPLQARSDNVPR